MAKGRLDRVDLTQHIESRKKYNKKLEKYQLKLLALQHQLVENKIAAVFVFEGWDAAGKGGAIKRAVANLDPRRVRVTSIAAPAPHEKRYHYMQRFWRKIPQYGQIAIFDRSWYGRVLVERIEGFAEKKEWKRAYDELNDFEKLLTDDHYIIEKFWLHISKDEQYRRFKEREENPMKRWKITSEDWRNRAKWDEYVEAAEEMFEKTDRPNAPWHIIPANSKWFARIAVVKQMVKAIETYLIKRGIPVQSYPDRGEIDESEERFEHRLISGSGFAEKDSGKGAETAESGRN
ncbi:MULTISPECIES: polyphosphate kinase 2 family protein [unclassified Sporolactobacillus]|uniref:polyphosphate kinase 2 family protein n=1 Tax=unclassified Sporolactobacillus TaxID=2628533 RepID=UPI002367D7F3|nr:UDP-galactose-lipid carrier transferase [Sporolactobacillus sp. CQH2019]MDD9150116.1 UDP-galactose-lipid carrier transferase [Sporolactobacillus sp. CQH2019]